MDNVKVEKVVGWVLLFAGLGIIVFAAINVTKVFTGKSEPYELFSFSSIGLDFSGLAGGQPVVDESALQQTLVEKDLLNKPINITAHVILMGFIS